MRKQVVGLYTRQQQRAYTRKYTDVIINERGKATLIHLIVMHPLSNFLDPPLLIINWTYLYIIVTGGWIGIVAQREVKGMRYCR